MLFFVNEVASKKNYLFQETGNFFQIEQIGKSENKVTKLT